MEDFLERFAQVNAAGEREFTVVREGLIVALLSVSCGLGVLVGVWWDES